MHHDRERETALMSQLAQLTVSPSHHLTSSDKLLLSSPPHKLGVATGHGWGRPVGIEREYIWSRDGWCGRGGVGTDLGHTPIPKALMNSAKTWTDDRT